MFPSPLLQNAGKASMPATRFLPNGPASITQSKSSIPARISPFFVPKYASDFLSSPRVVSYGTQPTPWRRNSPQQWAPWLLLSIAHRPQTVRAGILLARRMDEVTIECRQHSPKPTLRIWLQTHAPPSFVLYGICTRSCLYTRWINSRTSSSLPFHILWALLPTEWVENCL